jgi:hypothetical protein
MIYLCFCTLDNNVEISMWKFHGNFHIVVYLNRSKIFMDTMLIQTKGKIRLVVMVFILLFNFENILQFK